MCLVPKGKEREKRDVVDKLDIFVQETRSIKLRKVLYLQTLRGLKYLLYVKATCRSDNRDENRRGLYPAIPAFKFYYNTGIMVVGAVSPARAFDLSEIMQWAWPNYMHEIIAAKTNIT